jgi:hypothetical protein
MKIRKFNESVEFEDIEDTLLEIYDVLGEPYKSEFDILGQKAYLLRWNLSFSMGIYNGVKELEPITKVLDCIKNIKSSQSRIRGYNIEFKITNILFIRLTPIPDKPSENYKFYVGSESRNVIFSYSEISKFFTDRGYTIKDIKEDEDMNYDTVSIEIVTDANRETHIEFIEMINQEIKASKLLRPVYSYISGNSTIIRPEDEKTYVRLDQNI